MLPNLAMSKILPGAQAAAGVPPEAGHSPEAVQKATTEVLAWELQARLEAHQLLVPGEQAPCRRFHKRHLIRDSHRALDLPRSIARLRLPATNRYQPLLLQLAQLHRL